MKNNLFITMNELSKLIYKHKNIKVSKTTCWRSLRQNNFSRKRTRVQITKEAHNKLTTVFKQEYITSDNLISIDETFFQLIDCPRYGYSKKELNLKNK